MRATKIEFRLRMVIIALIISLGFSAPWIEALGIGRRSALLEWFALEISRLGLLRFTVATPAVIVIAALIAALAVVLRVWGTAYLGHGIVAHAQMQAGRVMADGPYRFVRNPLYLGTWLTTAAMAFLMPPSGALFAMALLTVFLLRLIFGEETFLAAQLGEPYQAYLRAVPRLIPRLRGAPAGADHKPRWLHGIFAETFPIGVFITLAFLSWSYDNLLLIKAILISLGVSLVVRAIMPRNPSPPTAS